MKRTVDIPLQHGRFLFLYCRHLHLPAWQRREPALSAPGADPYSKWTAQSRHTWSDFPVDTESHCSLIFFPVVSILYTEQQIITAQ